MRPIKKPLSTKKNSTPSEPHSTYLSGQKCPSSSNVTAIPRQESRTGIFGDTVDVAGALTGLDCQSVASTSSGSACVVALGGAIGSSELMLIDQINPRFASSHL